LCVKQDNLDVRAVKYVFIDYPKGMKCYKLWKMKLRGGSIIFISKDLTFDKTCIKMKCKDLDTINSKTGGEKNIVSG